MHNLKGLRGFRNLSQKELAAKAKMSQTEISHIERGLKPTKNQLKKITRALGLRTQINGEKNVRGHSTAKNRC